MSILLQASSGMAWHFKAYLGSPLFIFVCWIPVRCECWSPSGLNTCGAVGSTCQGYRIRDYSVSYEASDQGGIIVAAGFAAGYGTDDQIYGVHNNSFG